jgi:transglutaminase-like putative cysteine protease
VLAVCIDILVQTVRMPALAAAPALVPILIPGFIIEAGAEAPTLVLAAAAYLLLLRVDVRVRRRARIVAGDEGDDAATVISPPRVPIASTLGATLGLAGAGLVIAAVLAASTPSISTSLLLGTGNPAAIFGRGVSPFIDLGRDLRRPDPQPAFHYFSPDGERPYFTLLTLEQFEGATWGVTEAAIDGDNTVDAMPRPDGLSRAVQSDEHPIDVTIDDVRTTWLPVPYPTTRVDGLRGSWFWEDGSLTVRGVDADTAGQRYQATWLEVDPTPAQLRTSDRRIPDELAPFLELPDDLPQVIVDTAAQLTDSAATPYDAAVAIQAFLRSPDFEYSTEAPVEEGYDGGGFDVIAQFLERRAGYCVHFASTMAVLAREAGIPARISVGYTQGSPSQERVGGLQRIEVDSHDLHAWPELYFEGVGWVPFEPTPGRGLVPDYSRPGAGESAGAPVPLPGSAAPSTSGRAEVDPGGGLVGMSGGLSGADNWWLRGGVIALLAAAILLAPAALRAGQRASRSRRIVRGERPADAAWTEFAATARDLGIDVGIVDTPRAVASRIAGREAFGDTDAGSALFALRDAVERERYGPVARAVASDADLLKMLDTARVALAADERTIDRVRAVLVPRSLVDRAQAAFGERQSAGA